MNDNRCRCEGTAMNGSDHCPSCFCEEFEETCTWPRNEAGQQVPWAERSEGERWAQALRRGR